MVKEPINNMKLFKAILRASTLRVCDGYWLVRERNIGPPPIGFTIGKSALTMSRTLSAIWSIFFYPPTA